MSKHDILEYFKDINCAYNSPVMFDTLKDMLDELESENQAHDWVSVKDRPPERPENWPHCEIERCYFLVALESGCVKSLGFDFADMRWHTTGSPVTHWMPLPKPPKEGKHDG